MTRSRCASLCNILLYSFRIPFEWAVTIFIYTKLPRPSQPYYYCMCIANLPYMQSYENWIYNKLRKCARLLLGILNVEIAQTAIWVFSVYVWFRFVWSKNFFLFLICLNVYDICPSTCSIVKFRFCHCTTSTTQHRQDFDMLPAIESVIFYWLALKMCIWARRVDFNGVSVPRLNEHCKNID